LVNKQLVGIFVLVFLVGNVIGYAINPTLETFTSSEKWKEPPALIGDITNFQDITTDLEGLGCKIIHLKEGGYFTNTFGVKNYTDFRAIAYNFRFVFLMYHFGAVPVGQDPWDYIDLVRLYTLFDGVVIEYTYEL